MPKLRMLRGLRRSFGPLFPVGKWMASEETPAPDLVRACGEKLTDQDLWAQFERRFQNLLFMYALRWIRVRGIQEDPAALVPDLTQEIYVRLVQNEGRVLRSFKGTTEFAVRAFLSRVAASVVDDYQKHMGRDKRGAQVIPIERARRESNRNMRADDPLVETEQFNSILSWIDIERVIARDADRKNARRNALIFQLHFIDGLKPAEIANFPGFGLTKSGVQTVLARLRKRIEE